LVLPSVWRLMRAAGGGWGDSDAGAATPTTLAASATGKIEWAPQIGFNLPPAVNVDLELVFAANDAGVPASERLTGQLVDIRATCPR
jgi:hypothetical protein